jgi:hypothetical protein
MNPNHKLKLTAAKSRGAAIGPPKCSALLSTSALAKLRRSNRTYDECPHWAAIAFDTWNPQSRRFAASKVRKQPYSIQTLCPFIVSKPLGLRRANMQPRKTVR